MRRVIFSLLNESEQEKEVSQEKFYFPFVNSNKIFKRITNQSTPFFSFSYVELLEIWEISDCSYKNVFALTILYIFNLISWPSEACLFCSCDHMLRFQYIVIWKKKSYDWSFCILENFEDYAFNEILWWRWHSPYRYVSNWQFVFLGFHCNVRIAKQALACD